MRKPILEGSNCCEDFEWEDLTSDLTHYMKKVNPKTGWKAVVTCFGWRGVDGYKYFHADNGSQLLSNILPNTDCHFKVFKSGRKIQIQNFHHDSPVGKEWYTITPYNKGR